VSQFGYGSPTFRIWLSSPKGQVRSSIERVEMIPDEDEDELVEVLKLVEAEDNVDDALEGDEVDEEEEEELVDAC
jgi:hypothetical protein